MTGQVQWAEDPDPAERSLYCLYAAAKWLKLKESSPESNSATYERPMLRL
jgi:hypothetical protein